MLPNIVLKPWANTKKLILSVLETAKSERQKKGSEDREKRTIL